MTWLESWEGSYSGEWLGSQEQAPVAVLAAIIHGSSALHGSLTISGEIKPPKGASIHHKRIQKDDEEFILCISQFMCIASNN